MARFTVSFSTTLYTEREIEAATEEEALKKAQDLVMDGGAFFDGIIDSWNNDYEAYRTKYCTVGIE